VARGFVIISYAARKVQNVGQHCYSLLSKGVQ